MLTVACVLKSGGDFTPEYVHRLRDDCRKHLKVEFGFVCLSDLWFEDVATISLEYNLPGWWSKLELFRLPGPVLYFDLDTRIVGDITPLGKYPYTPGNLYALKTKHQDRFGSGIMAWDGDFSWILDTFLNIYPQARKIPGIGPGPRACETLDYLGEIMFGDQDFLQTLRPELEVSYIQEVFPQMYSYKNHCKGGIPEDAKIVYFHGVPRPHEITEGPLKW